jgi:hypothetical protein
VQSRGIHVDLLVNNAGLVRGGEFLSHEGKAQIEVNVQALVAGGNKNSITCLQMDSRFERARRIWRLLVDNSQSGPALPER